MLNDMPYQSKHPDDHGLYSYDAEDAAVWALLFDRQMAGLQDVATPAFFDGVAQLGLRGGAVPQVSQLSQRLQSLSGASATGVPAIIPPKQFFTLLSNGSFPVATFLRRRAHIDYIEEPDLFHEVFGHLPLLTQRPFAGFVRTFGKIALSLPKGSNWHMFRLFWFTVEFGMIQTRTGLRAYGAGILSSPSEAANAMSGQAKMQPFDLLTVLRTPYRIDIVQPLYFVIQDFDQLVQSLRCDIPALVEQAKHLGDLPPLYELA